LKVKPLLEVLLIFVLFNVLKPIGTLLTRTGILEKEINLLGWSYLGGVFLIILSVAILLLTHRNFADYGLTLANWQIGLDLGLLGYLLSLIPFGLGFGVLMASLHTGYELPMGALILSLCYLVAITLLLLILQRRQKSGADEKAIRQARSNLIIIFILSLLPILVGLLVSRFNLRLVSTVVWQLFISGFGEEIYYRGYIQSRLNHAFGKPFKLAGLEFGWGLVIASLIFGITHTLNPFVPLTGQFQLSWWWGVWTVFAGLFFGILREKSGSILASGITHGVVDAVGEGLNVIFGFF